MQASSLCTPPHAAPPAPGLEHLHSCMPIHRQRGHGLHGGSGPGGGGSCRRCCCARRARRGGHAAGGCARCAALQRRLSPLKLLLHRGPPLGQDAPPLLPGICQGFEGQRREGEHRAAHLQGGCVQKAGRAVCEGACCPWTCTHPAPYSRPKQPARSGSPQACPPAGEALGSGTHAAAWVCQAGVQRPHQPLLDWAQGDGAQQGVQHGVTEVGQHLEGHAQGRGERVGRGGGRAGERSAGVVQHGCTARGSPPLAVPFNLLAPS